MRTLRSAASRTALAGILFFIACNSGPALPKCEDGQGLGVDASGKIFCKPAPEGQLQLPSCNPDTEALTTDGLTLRCTRRDAPDGDPVAALTQLLMLSVAANDMSSSLNKYKGASRHATLAGITTATTMGRITSGLNIGLAAAAQQCSAQFPGSHMCTVYELYESVAAGKLTATSAMASAWVYFPAWNMSVPTGENPEEGVGDNCAGYSYPLAARGWRGVRAEWGPLPSGEVGLLFHGGANMYCPTASPIACCK
jgi:hypothetical protein